MTAIFVSFLCTLAHVPSLVLRYLPFAEKIDRRQKRLLVLLYGVALAANFAWCMVLEAGGGVTIPFYKLNLLLFCMVMTLVNLLVLRGHAREHLFTFGLVAIVVTLLLSVSSFAVDAMTYLTVQQGLIEVNLMLLVLFTVLYFPIKRMLLHTVTPFLDIEGKNYWSTIWFIPIAMFFASLLSNPVNVYINTVPQLLGRMLIGVATLLLCRSIAMDYGRMRERESMGRQITLQKQYYDALTEKVNAERKQRHDFKHHLAALGSLVDARDIDGVRAYFETMAEAQPAEVEIPYTGNTAADGVLYHYAALAAQNGIRFTARCTLTQVSLSDVALCSLLGNALDNAVTACAAYDGRRLICISSETEGDMLAITVDNSFDGVLLRSGDALLSKKRQGEAGIGISSMRQVCEAHGGLCRFTAKGELFEASFLLPL